MAEENLNNDTMENKNSATLKNTKRRGYRKNYNPKTEAQEKVICFRKGFARVNAGAGAGKRHADRCYRVLPRRSDRYQRALAHR